MRLISLLVAVASLGLIGCSSLPRNSGFEVRQSTVLSRQEPWQNRSFNRTVFDEDGSVGVAYVRLSQPLPERWRQEIIDPNRVYEVRDGRRRTPTPLVREVFRAVAINALEETKVYDAVFDRDKRGLMVLFPWREAEQLRQSSLYILSSDGRWGMTATGQLLDFDQGFVPDRFAHYPASSLIRLFRITPDKLEGRRYVADYEYLGKLLGEALERFSHPFKMRDGSGRYLGTPDVLVVMGEFTAVEGWADCVLSCTSLKLGPESIAAAPIVATLYSVQLIGAFAKEDCHRPLFKAAANHDSQPRAEEAP